VISDVRGDLRDDTYSGPKISDQAIS
jgi:hypothetical protein